MSYMLRENKWLSCIQPISLADGANLSVAPLTKYATTWWHNFVFRRPQRFLLVLALLLSTDLKANQQSPWCLVKNPWLGRDLWGSQSDSEHHTNSNTSTLTFTISKGHLVLLTELTTSWCCPLNWTSLILRLFSYSLEIYLLKISHLLKNNAPLNNGLTDLFLFNLLFPKLTYPVISPITRRTWFSALPHHFLGF